MDKIVEHWKERAQYDLDTAKAMQKAGRYLYVSYMCQQAIEKILKAHVAASGKEHLPIHNLTRLMQYSEAQDLLTEDQKELLAELMPYCIEARYGDYKESLSEIINESEAERILKSTGSLFQCLYQKLN